MGGRKIEHLLSNIQALDIHLTDEDVKEIEGVLPFELGFPGGLMVSLFVFVCSLLACFRFRIFGWFFRVWIGVF